MNDKDFEMKIDFLLAFLAPICDPDNPVKWKKNFEDKHSPKREEALLRTTNKPNE